MKAELTPEGILTGIGLTLAATALLPALKTVARPIGIAGMQGIQAIGNQVKGGVAYIKEEIEDLVAEAQFERMKRTIDSDIAEA